MKALQGSRGWFFAALEEAEIEGIPGIVTGIPCRLIMVSGRSATVAELLGHRTLQMVMRCSHFASQHQASAVDWLVNSGNEGDTRTDTGAFPVRAAKQKHSVNNVSRTV